MRVANKTIYDFVKFNLGSISTEMSKANRIVATGKRIHDLSDDPVGLVQSLKIKSGLSGLNQLGRNINLGTSWLSATEGTLTNVQDIISDAKTLSIQMATATTGQTERNSSAMAVQNMLDEIVSLANTQVNGRYIFAGSRTEASPFSQNGTYSGNTTAFSIKISQTETFAIGNDGSAVFGNVFTSLSTFKTALESNDIDSIQAAIDDLGNDFDHISNTISDVGSRANRMEVKERIYQDLKITNTDRLSKIEDADITEAIMDLKGKELAYQAALASSVKVMQLSLVDYFR